MNNHKDIVRIGSALLASACLMAPMTANAANFQLCAGEVDVTMADGAIIPMWGYAEGGATAGVCDNTPTIPGPVLRNPVGDTKMSITLANTLPDYTSIVMPGQVQAMKPTFVDGRVVSFTKRTAPGGARYYGWTNVKPGTFTYHSGSHSQVQVQMGLYGAAILDSGVGEAYPGVSYDDDAVIYYSEIDPLLHDTVANGLYGVTMTSTINYQPKYFLVNGQGYDPASTPAAQAQAIGSPGSRTLLRILNMGLKQHTAVLQGPHVLLVAEDGNPYTHPKEQYSIMMAAGKTKDALLDIPVDAAGSIYPVYDRALSLTNNTDLDGGMLAYLAVDASPANDTVQIIRSRYANNTDRLKVWARSSEQPTPSLDVTGYGAMDFKALRGFYLLNEVGVLANPFTVEVTSSAGGSDIASTNYTAPASAGADNYVVSEDTVLSDTAPGVLVNDDLGGVINTNAYLQAGILTPPNYGVVALNPDGSFTYTPDPDANGIDSFTYEAVPAGPGIAGGSASEPAIVTIIVDPVNDAPVAVNDSGYTTGSAIPLSIPAEIGVLINDTDVDGDKLTAAIVAGPTHGSVTLHADGSFDYVPNDDGATSDSFTYVANDGALDSNIATVSIVLDITVPNQAPVANDDAATATQKPVGSPATPIVIDLAANDTDIDGTVVPATVTLVAINLDAAAQQGSIVNNGDGTVTYTPDRARGSYTVTYTINDDEGATSNVATLRINVVQ